MSTESQLTPEEESDILTHNALAAQAQAIQVYGPMVARFVRTIEGLRRDYAAQSKENEALRAELRAAAKPANGVGPIHEDEIEYGDGPTPS